MVSTLTVGVILTALAWIGLQVTVIHGKYVVDKIAEGAYDKGPMDRQEERGPDE